MRISDWSSDVFSSDLIFEPLGLVGDVLDAPGGFEIFQGKDRLIASLNSHGIVVNLDKSIGKIDGGSRILYPGFVIFIPGSQITGLVIIGQQAQRLLLSGVFCQRNCLFQPVNNLLNGRSVRSEEHTSELQSLMRISYAVFCLKKKK